MSDADSIRIATYAAPLSRDGPGLLLRDLDKGTDPQIAAIVEVISRVSPDVLTLTDFDFDLEGRALRTFAELVDYPYHYARLPNTGMATGMDLDGNGYLGDARDAQGYGRFAGDGGMAVLSRYPIGDVTDYSAVLWADVPDAVWPVVEGAPFPSTQAHAVQRLSTSGHWVVPIQTPDGSAFSILVFAATPPVFDGPEDKNGLRNRDELRLIEQMIDTTLGAFVVAGNANLDPVDGQGFSGAMATFLTDSRIQDPKPRSAGGQAAADHTHIGNPAFDTADWPTEGPGNLRVSYVLPSTEFTVLGAGVYWPAPDSPDAAVLGPDGLLAGPHRLVWVDVAR